VVCSCLAMAKRLFSVNSASPRSMAVQADCDLVDAKQFLSASFENFVWFTPAELQAALHNALSLYNGILPASGAMPDDVVAVLSKLLASRNLPNQVSTEKILP